MNKIKIKKIKSDEELELSFSIRKEVFCHEQGVDPSVEIDEYDSINDFSIHVLALINNEPCGTGRLLFKENPETKIAKIGRMAISINKRKLGIGKEILDYLENEAKLINFHTINLDAQVHAQEFYKNSGYKPSGTVFELDNIKHIKMSKSLRSLRF